MYNFQNYDITNILVIIIVVLGAMGAAGYLFNYFIVKELKIMNAYLRHLSDIMGYNLKTISDKTGSVMNYNPNYNPNFNLKKTIMKMLTTQIILTEAVWTTSGYRYMK